MMSLSQIQGHIAAAGLAFRGGLNPPDMPGIGTLILVGFAGRGQWPGFAASPEAQDGHPDPLDRWSRRVVGALAEELGAVALFPFGGPPFQPFLRWAQQAEPVRPSPLGILIHPDWGLWHAYRGALAFDTAIDLPEPDRRPSPCDSCAGKPCLAACPVGAFSGSGYDVPACVGHLSTDAGIACVDHGCRARRACPAGAQHRYGEAQERFHLEAFRRANPVSRRAAPGAA
jgi:hypothetical protein